MAVYDHCVFHHCPAAVTSLLRLYISQKIGTGSLANAHCVLGYTEGMILLTVTQFYYQ
jgi:hypothetical protein